MGQYPTGSHGGSLVAPPGAPPSQPREEDKEQWGISRSAAVMVRRQPLHEPLHAGQRA